MKIILIILISILGQEALAMGSNAFGLRRISPAESDTLNDMTETTSRTNMFSDGRGYEDQQMMDEDPQLMQERIDAMKEKDEAVIEKEFEKKEEEFSLESPKIYHE